MKKKAQAGNGTNRGPSVAAGGIGKTVHSSKGEGRRKVLGRGVPGTEKRGVRFFGDLALDPDLDVGGKSQKIA